MANMLKCSEGHVLLSATYFEIHKKRGGVTDRRMDM